jgi:tetratricopeptide (TPR) repeat protein
MPQLPSIDDAWNFSDPAASEQAFRDMLAEYPDAPEQWRLTVQTQLARALGLQSQFDDAHAVLDDIESRLGTDPKANIRYLLERGRVFNSSGEPGRALQPFEDAFQRAREAGNDALAVDAAHMIAIVAGGEDALEWNELALSIAEHSDQPKARRWLGSLYNNIGWTYYDLDKTEEALEIFKRGVAWQREHGTEEGQRVARWTVGRTLRSLGRVEEALEIQRDLDGADDPYVDEELGHCLRELGRHEEAQPHFDAAYQSLKDDPWVQKNEPEKLERLRELSRTDR